MSNGEQMGCCMCVGDWQLMKNIYLVAKGKEEVCRFKAANNNKWLILDGIWRKISNENSDQRRIVIELFVFSVVLVSRQMD